LKRQSKKQPSTKGKGGDSHKGSFNSSLNSYEGEDGKKGQPPLPLVPPRWGGMPPNKIPYSMVSYHVTCDSNNWKLWRAEETLKLSKYIKNSNPNTDVHVFKQMIKINDVIHEGTKITYFQWMLQDISFNLGGQFCE
jgi:hypothetical protein